MRLFKRPSEFSKDFAFKVGFLVNMSSRLEFDDIPEYIYVLKFKDFFVTNITP